jgi:regulator of replication initiation timing
MARPSDREFELKRQIREMKEQNGRLEDEIKKLKKQLEKTEVKDPNPKKKGKVIAKPCPDCGAETRITDLPHAKMELCSAGCGYRNVRNK